MISVFQDSWAEQFRAMNHDCFRAMPWAISIWPAIAKRNSLILVKEDTKQCK